MTPKKRFFIIVSAGVLTNTILIVSWWLFLVLWIRPSYEELRSLLATHALLEKKAQDLHEREQHIEARAQDVKNLENGFLRPGEEIRLVTALETIAKTSSTTIAFRSAVIPPDLQKQHFSLFEFSALGKPEHVIAFLSHMERMPFFIRIASLTINPVGGESSAMLQAAIQLSVFTVPNATP